MMKKGRDAWRRWISICLVAVLCIGMFPTAAMAALTLPEAVKEIQSEAFLGADSLDEVILPEGIERIGARAFANSSLNSIYLPESLTYVDDTAFSGCSDLQVTVHKNSYAHEYCKRLNIPCTVIGLEAAEILQHPESVTVSMGEKAEFSVLADHALSFAWQVSYDNGVTWSIFSEGKTTGNRNYITVEAEQNLLYRCRVTGEDGEEVFSQSAHLVVSAPTVHAAGVTLDVSSLQLNKNETHKLTAHVTPENAIDKTVEWSTSNADVAIVTDGTVTAMGPGSAVITATVRDGGMSASCSVECKVPVQNVVMERSSLSIFMGDSVQLIAEVFPQDADQTLQWSSSNEQVAVVDQTGVVTALSAGNVQITAASGYIKDTCSIKISAYAIVLAGSSSATISPAGEQWETDFYANSAWTATSNCSWLTVQTPSGTGHGSVQLAAEANQGIFSRTGQVTIVCGTDSAVYTVTQPCLKFSLSSNTWSDVSEKGATTSLKLSANASWTAASDCDWLSLSPASGSGNSTVTITAAANPGDASRTGKITFSCNGITALYTVQQRANSLSLGLRALYGSTVTQNPEKLETGYGGGSYYLTINTAGAWNIQSDASWISFSKASGSDTDTITMTIGEWDSKTADRQAVIRVSAGNLAAELPVTQQKIGVLEISGGPGKTLSSSSHQCVYSIVSNGDWQIRLSSEAAEWITVTPMSGSGNGSITVTIAPNNGAVRREADITFVRGTVSTFRRIEQHPSEEMSVEPASLMLDAAGGSVSMTVSCNSSFTAVTETTWLTVSPYYNSATTSGTTTLTVRAAANTATTHRTGEIVLTCGDLELRVPVRQKPKDSISVSPAQKKNAAPDGGEYTISVTANGAWTALSDSSWLTVDAASGSGSASLKVTAASNSTGAARTGVITLQCGTASTSFTLTQDSHSVSISPASASAASSGGTTTFSVTANGAWTVQAGSSWMTAEKMEGSVKVTAAENTSSRSRTGKVTVKCGSASAVYTLTQNAYGALSVSRVTASPTVCPVDERVTYTIGVTGGKAPYSVHVTEYLNDTFKYEYTFYSSSEEYTYVADFTSPGVNRISVSVTDSLGNTASGRSSDVQIITVLDGGISVPESEYTTDETVPYTIRVSGGLPPYTVKVTETLNGVYKYERTYSGSGLEYSYVADFTSPGTSRISAVITDSTGASITRQSPSVSVQSTLDAVVSVPRTSYTTDETVPYAIRISGGQAPYTVWVTEYLNGVYKYERTYTGSETEYSYVADFSQPGTSSITVTVTDSAGTSLIRNSANVTVSSGLDVSVTVPETQYSLDETVPYAIRVSGGRAPYTVQVIETLNGIYKYERTYTGSGTEYSYIADFSSPGTSAVRVTVTDSTGASVSRKSVDVSVISTLELEITVPRTSYSLDEVVPYTICVGGGRAPYTVQVKEYLNGAYKYERTYTGSGTEYSYVADFTVAGTSCIVVTVTDGSGAVVTQSSSLVSVGRSVSRIAILAPGGSELQHGVMTVGTDNTLSARVEPADATNKAVRWSSSDSSIVQIDANTGSFIAHRAGTVTITASAVDNSGVKATCILEVIDMGVSITSDKNAYQQGEECCYEIRVRNADAPMTLYCREYFNGQLFYELTFENGNDTTYIYYSSLDRGPGSYALEVEVEDARGLSVVGRSADVSVVSGNTFDPIWPCESARKVTCLYYYKDGTRHSTRYGYRTGMDIGGGGNIVAAESGRVTKVADLGGSSYGKYIEITHPNGMISLYAHLSRQYVAEGQMVSKGQTIGVMGDSGNASGIHLHFELSGCDPMKDYFYEKYKTNIAFESNVYSNNQSFNADKWICQRILAEYSKSGNYYYYKGASNPVSTKTSAQGIAFIKSWEGCSLTAYDDGKGILTIGYGHVLQPGEPHTITQAQADAYFLQDLAQDGEARVDAFVRKTGAILNQHQYDALVSFFYNLGSAGPSMTALFTDYAASLASIPEWRLYNQFANYYSRNDVNVRQGLFRRRLDEARIFIDGIYERRQWTIPNWCKNGEVVPSNWYPVELDR